MLNRTFTMRGDEIHSDGTASSGEAAIIFARFLRSFRFALAGLSYLLRTQLEGLNTAIEAAIDLVSPDIHPLAKIAKDLAAGMVLIAAMASASLGLLILGPPLWAKLFG